MNQRTTRTPFLATLGIAASAFCTTASVAQTTVDFDDLTLESESAYYGEEDGTGFFSNGFFFNNEFTDWGGGFTSWAGWAYSNQTDTTTPGFDNEFSAIAGGGANADGSAEEGDIFAVGFGAQRGSSIIEFPEQTIGMPLSIMVTNTTYAYYSMLEGDDFAKQFGGPDGTDPDFFILTIYGLDHAGAITGEVDVALADYTDPDPQNDYILDSWTEVDLAPLGDEVTTLTFSLASSDLGAFGINTPTYFAIDNLEVELAPQLIADAVQAEGGWKLGWPGYYMDAQAPWMYHYQLGWLYWDDTESGVWFYSQAADSWFWTSRTSFPYIWRSQPQDWIYFFHRSDPEELQFYSFSENAWKTGADHLGE